MTAKLSAAIRDEISGADEDRSRDAMLSRFADQAEILEGHLPRRPGLQIRVGEHIRLSFPLPQKVWLEWDDGEGMMCDERDFAAHIEEFYNEHF